MALYDLLQITDALFYPSLGPIFQNQAPNIALDMIAVLDYNMLALEGSTFQIKINSQIKEMLTREQAKRI